MATINASITRVGNNGLVLQWTPVTENDTMATAAIDIGDYADRSIQVSGTIGGTTITVQGSNDASAFSALRNVLGSAISITAADLVSVLEACRYIKPVRAGGASASITVTIFARRSRGGKEV
jgi:hypothetical protein